MTKNRPKVALILRSRTKDFFSLEKVFGILNKLLDTQLLVLPYQSNKVVRLLKNIYFFRALNADILHISGHDHYLLWLPKRKTILTIHDIEALNRKRGLRKWIFKKLWFDIPLSNASVVTTISEFTKSELLLLGNYKAPIKVIYNPITIDLDYSPKPLLSKKPRVLHLGTKKNKNLPRLLKAIEGLDIELVIIGNLSKDLQFQIKKSKSLIVVKKSLSDDELVKEYEACDILSFISTYEGFGLPIIEAQSIGRVVLTSNVASMPEVAGEGAYFVDPYSVEDIRKGIEELIKNDSLRKELVEKGRENVKRFEPKKIAAQYQELYDQVANEA